jgi:hypothetical protein
MTASFNAADGAAMVALAALTELDLTDLFLQPPWQLIQTFRSPTSSHAQGFVALGALPSNPNAAVAVVAIGSGWSDFIESYLPSQHTLSFPPSSLFPAGTAGFPMADLGYSNMYSGVRDPMWASVLFAKRTVPDFASSMPVVVTGIGPGAPLAQFAAVDLLPGHVWRGSTSPATSVTAYTFSNVSFGNADFALAINKNVPAAFSVNLKTGAGVVVDPYPTAPGSAAGYFPAGQPIGGDARIPEADCPWIERGPAYYQQTLLGQTISMTASTPRPQRREFAAGVLAARAASAPEAKALGDSAYSPTLAYTLTLLDLAAYQRALHPDLPLHLPAPYVFATDLIAGGVTWGALFVSPDRVVAAFRGTATWQETVDAWGNISLSKPAWLSLDGRILTQPAKLYESLRDVLRQQLVAIRQPSRPLVISGHDTGGTLASQAMLDLTLNPQEGAPAASAVYTFGAPPLGDIAFSKSFNGRVGANSFQVARPDDVIPQLVFGAASFAITVPTQVLLQGGIDDPANGSTFHPLTIYSQLLNPQSFLQFAARDLTASERSHYEEGAGQQILPGEITKCPLDSAQSDGRLQVSWETYPSPVPPKRSYEKGTAYIGAMQVIVRPGHEMVIEAPHGQRVQFVATELVLSPGSQLTIATNARLHVSRLVVPELADVSMNAQPPRVYVVGTNGANGSAGPAGPNGMNGGPRQPGAPGGPAGAGHSGLPGGNAVDAELYFDTIEGRFVVYGRGGEGGAGGSGGAGGAGGIGGPIRQGLMAAGGAGGDGGPGGNGGNAGNGSTVTIVYRTLAPGAEIVVETPQAAGGAGGIGGRGGSGGRGQPSGTSGAAGAAGPAGLSGRKSTVTIIQRSN